MGEYILDILSVVHAWELGFELLSNICEWVCWRNYSEVYSKRNYFNYMFCWRTNLPNNLDNHSPNSSYSSMKGNPFITTIKQHGDIDIKYPLTCIKTTFNINYKLINKLYNLRVQPRTMRHRANKKGTLSIPLGLDMSHLVDWFHSETPEAPLMSTLQSLQPSGGIVIAMFGSALRFGRG